MAFRKKNSHDAAEKNSAEPPDFTKKGVNNSAILVACQRPRVKLNPFCKERIKKTIENCSFSAGVCHYNKLCRSSSKGLATVSSTSVTATLSRKILPLFNK